MSPDSRGRLEEEWIWTSFVQKNVSHDIQGIWNHWMIEWWGFSQPIPAHRLALPWSLRSSLTYSSMYGVQSAKGLSWLDSIQKMADSIYTYRVFSCCLGSPASSGCSSNLREHCLVNQQPQITLRSSSGSSSSISSLSQGTVFINSLRQQGRDVNVHQWPGNHVDGSVVFNESLADGSPMSYCVCFSSKCWLIDGALTVRHIHLFSCACGCAWPMARSWGGTQFHVCL